jgi:hypothetical protein
MARYQQMAAANISGCQQRGISSGTGCGGNAAAQKHASGGSIESSAKMACLGRNFSN